MLTAPERQHLTRSFNGVVVPMTLQGGRLSGYGGLPRQMDYNLSFISLDVATGAIEVGLLMDGRLTVVSGAPRAELSAATRAWIADLPPASRDFTFRQAGAAAAPAAAAAQRSAWRLSAPSPAQWSLVIAATERGGSLELSCTRSTPGVVMSFMAVPRGWRFTGQQATIEIDGAARRMEVDGADQGFVLSDTTQNNAVALSEDLRRQLAAGRQLRVQGLVGGGRPRSLVFDIAGGAAPFAAFEQNCRALR